MLQPHSIGQWFRSWLYDWCGANLELFLAINRELPNDWLWLPELLSGVGSYWGAPVVVVLLLLRRRMQSPPQRERLGISACKFLSGLVLALSAGALAKAMWAMPRPYVLLGEGIYRTVIAPDSRYSMPSGHATYVGALAAALWPVLGWSARIGLLLFGAAVGWSRVVLGAHFPADVVAGFVLGWACVAAAGPLMRRFGLKLAASEGSA